MHNPNPPVTLTLRQLEITLADFRANGWAAMDAESRAILNAYWQQNKATQSSKAK